MLHLVGFVLTLNYNARNHEFKKKLVTLTAAFGILFYIYILRS